MKAIGLLIVIFFMTFAKCSILTEELPYFMGYIGTYISKSNPLDNGKYPGKHYYITQGSEHTWRESNFYCQSIGLQLATIESEDEVEYFVKRIIYENINHFKNCIFLQASVSNSSKRICESICGPQGFEPTFKIDDCDGTATRGFMCEQKEDVEIPEGFDSIKQIDPKDIFLNYVGDYATTQNKTKKYYISHQEGAYQTESTLLCLFFNMILATPQTTEEFNAIENILEKSDVPSGSKYHLSYGAYNLTSVEDKCIYFQRSTYSSTIYKESENCRSIKTGFVCEKDDSQELTPVEVTPEEFDELFVPMSSYMSEGRKKELFISTFPLKWSFAVFACKFYGMKILLPETKEDETKVIESINDFLVSKNYEYIEFETGATSMGKDYFYSINSGEMLTIPLGLREFQRNKCLRLFIRNKADFSYRIWNCLGNTLPLMRFVCEKSV